MNTLPRPRPLVVVILDGWGISPQRAGNAIAAAQTPAMDTFARFYPSTALAASGLEVGLPPGVGGNSETGHRNIGAGRVEYQLLSKIDQAMADGSFFNNPVLAGAFEHAQAHASSLHLIGLASSGGVHAHVNHLLALLEMAGARRFQLPVYLHLITDGRDAPPRSALGYLQQITERQRALGIGIIASVVGRFYAMDRNNNWERTGAAYELFTGGERQSAAATAYHAVDRAYKAGLTDEMILPTAITRGGRPIGAITDNDAVIFTNFRPDRARQLTAAFVDAEQMPMKTRRLQNVYFATLGWFGSHLTARAAWREEAAEFPLARVIAEAGLTQLHIAETEKYAHITYYLNVGHEAPFAGEQREIIRSADVRSFIQKPAMEAPAITQTVVSAVQRGAHDVYFVNYANPDMVGHTGDFAAVVAACGVVDMSLAQLYQAVRAAGGSMVVTADHGKAEAVMAADTSQQRTEHTTNPVPFHYVREELKRRVPRSQAEVQQQSSTPVGVLADVAPTILDILRLTKPRTMTGVSLLGSLE
ncbi:MAG: 2,3-bisphosphoglycerate-independent phosphoglycerate mutase [Candidatus Andersenbacteria bacterium]|nr:2,3-bisphosphoglycerate-independent phosphoglycerate mutase [Candidatus Andersenbacteria bacterium]